MASEMNGSTVSASKIEGTSMGVFDHGSRVYSGVNKPSITISITRDLLTTSMSNDNSDITVSNLMGNNYTFFEIILYKSSDNKLSTGLIPNTGTPAFSCYKAGFGGMNGYKKSSSVIHITDCDSVNNIYIYGIKLTANI